MNIRIKFNNGDSSDRIQASASVDEYCCVTIQMKPLQQYFHMVLFISYVVLTFESMDEILWCHHSYETSSAILSHGTIYFVRSSNF